MPHRQDSPDDRRLPAERLIERSLVDPAHVGRDVSERALHRERTVEAYLRGEMLPRYITRARDIERAVRAHEHDLRRAYRELSADCAGRDHEFAERWTACAEAWNFEEVNRLVREHNDWYPVERDLPMDPRTRDYVSLNGRSYRRTELGSGWVLVHFPAHPPQRDGALGARPPR